MPPNRNSDPAAYSVREFCEAHSLSRAFFYKLRDQGMGPQIMKLGRRTLISREAAQQWRQRTTEGDLPPVSPPEGA